MASKELLVLEVPLQIFKPVADTGPLALPRLRAPVALKIGN
jgi:hypothetical protein